MEKRRGGNGGQKYFQKTEGKVLDSCVVPASTYGLETLALSELHQHKLQVCENNWIRKIAGVKETGETENERPIETRSCSADFDVYLSRHNTT